MADRLAQLLRDADARLAVPQAQTDLPKQVRRRRDVQRRRTRGAIAGTAALLLLTLVLAPLLRRHRQQPAVAIAPTPTSQGVPRPASRPPARSVPAPPPPPAVAASPRGEVESLELDAQLHERVADQLIATQRARRRSTATPPAHDPTLADLQQQRDRAALLLVYEGEQYRRRKQTNEAVASYRRAIELFPQTHWADVARQRLRDM